MTIVGNDNGELEVEIEKWGNSISMAFDGGAKIKMTIDEFALALDEKARAMIIQRLDEEPISK